MEELQQRDEAIVCRICNSSSNLLNFPCSHKYCADCLILHTLPILYNFHRLILQDPDILSGRASCLGCPMNCLESDLTLSLVYLNEHAQLRSALDQDKKKFFKEVLLLGSSFFSGIKTYFFKCIKCNLIRANINKKLIICRFCIDKMIENQIGIIINYSIT